MWTGKCRYAVDGGQGDGICKRRKLWHRLAMRPMLRLVLTAIIAACRRDQRHGCRSHSSCSAKDRNAGVGTRRHQDAWSRSQARSRDRTDRARLDRSRQDRAQGRLGRSDAVGLAVGRARALARRQPGVLSLVEHARRRDGAGAIADPGASPISRARSSRSPAVRSTRAGCCCRRWRAAPASISGSRPRSSMARRRCCRRRRCRARSTPR